jgi:hypothetical protein
MTEELQQPGLDALRKERERADAAEKQLKELQGKVGSADVLANELNTTKSLLAAEQKKRESDFAELQKTLAEKESAIASLKIEQAFHKAVATAKLNPAYSDLLLKANSSEFVVTESGIVTKDGKSLDDWAISKKAEMPQLFLPPEIPGSGTIPGKNSTSKKGVISRDNPVEFMGNLDAIASGEIDTV